MDVMLFLGILLLFTTFQMYVADKNKICYESKTCIHNAVEKCGVNREGEVRRFLDSCDLLEFNCLNEANYIKTSLTKCRSLPPLSDTDSKSQQQSDSKAESRQKQNSDEWEPILVHNNSKEIIQEELSSHE